MAEAQGAKPVVAVDLDEVLGFFVQSIASYHNDAHGTALKQEHFVSYRFSNVWGGTDEEATEKVHNFFGSPHFLNGIDVVPDALEALQGLAHVFDFKVVTSRQHVIEEETRRWIGEHYPGVFSDILFGNHWGKTGAKVSKPDMCRAIGAVALVDDSLAYATQCAEAGVLRQSILFGSYPWNQAEGALAPGIVRVAGWAGAKAVLQGLALELKADQGAAE